MTFWKQAGTAKSYRQGSHRSVDPEKTLQRVAPLLKRAGITRIANVTGLDTIGIPVVVVCRPNSRNLAVSQGKGPTLPAAKASGVMESVEFWHAETITQPLRLASEAELSAELNLINTAGIAVMSRRHYDPSRRITWIEGRDLLRDRSVWLPYELVHMDYTLPLPESSNALIMSSGGLASGNCTAEAVSHAICERIEHDSDAIWAARPKSVQARTRLDLASVDDPLSRDLIDQIEAAGITVAVWDTTSDLGIASFRCSILDREPNRYRPMSANSGMGCHPARNVALARALTEAAQSRLTMISSSRDDMTRADYDVSASSDLTNALREEYESQDCSVQFQDVADYQHETIDEDVEFLLARLAERGFPEVAMVDLGKPGLDVSVVRVVIPGLESTHFAAGYQRGPRASAAAKET